MSRKKWSAQTELTDELLRQREKRKWQIALRRYVFFQSPCSNYAPYFSLDAKSLRQWIESQFDEEMNWDNFSRNWQLDHIVPVSFFDFNREEDLKLCWNFTNISVQKLKEGKPAGHPHHLLDALAYFTSLRDQTYYPICASMVEKINSLGSLHQIASDKQAAFIRDKMPYLNTISGFHAHEFDQLNSGMGVESILEERRLLGQT
jgi:hypothetical protein